MVRMVAEGRLGFRRILGFYSCPKPFKISETAVYSTQTVSSSDNARICMQLIDVFFLR